MYIEVYMDSTEEAERLVGWGCNVILLDLLLEIILKVRLLNRGQYQ